MESIEKTAGVIDNRASSLTDEKTTNQAANQMGHAYKVLKSRAQSNDTKFWIKVGLVAVGVFMLISNPIFFVVGLVAGFLFKKQVNDMTTWMKDKWHQMHDSHKPIAACGIGVAAVALVVTGIAPLFFAGWAGAQIRH